MTQETEKIAQRFDLMQDDDVVVTDCDEFEAMRYIHRRHCYSFHHGLLHEGYRLVPREATDAHT